MSAEILSGKAIAEDLRKALAIEVDTLKRDHRETPGLGVVLVGDNPASRSYVTAKEKACAELGMYSREETMPASASLDAILGVVRDMNRDPRIHGILVQLPLPDGAMEQAILEAVVPEKDVDGFHPVNVGRMLLGLPCFLPCTPHGILHMLKRGGVTVKGAHAVVIGRSNIVGRPLANLLSMKSALGNATVTLCHTGTPDVARFTREADIVVAAAGRPDTVTADMIREGAVVIDVGTNRIEDPSRRSGFRLVGDVDFEAVKEKASKITPVPGGVGPMTITMLLYNTVLSARRRLGLGDLDL